MKKDTVVSIDQPETTRDALTEVLREGAQKLIAGSGADRIVGAIRPGVRRGEAAYAAMT